VSNPGRGAVNLWHELQAGPELAWFMMSVSSLIAAAPAGDGHHVLVLPGLGGGDASTRPLRHALDRLGYAPHGWGQGINRGLRRDALHSLHRRVAELVEASGRRVSLIGWSLGGLYAVALARDAPRRVRTVITLGSPHAGRPAPAVVPMTSIYSRSDQIVPWQASLIAPTKQAENVEVSGSHLGLGHNPAAFAVIADRLHQPADQRQPFEPPTWAQRWLPKSYGHEAPEAQPPEPDETEGPTDTGGSVPRRPPVNDTEERYGHDESPA
jgi:pimeloyl-ACP methyl ester carboxylesterase